MQFGRIGNFGLLEMTRQRLKESSIKWETNLSLESFAQKVVKKIEMLAFSNKAKIVDIKVPGKIKTYINENLSKEINHFKKKYKLEFNIMSDETLSIPEYKINLLNKNKKIIKKVENIEKIYTNNNQNNKNYIMNKKSFRPRKKFKKFPRNRRNIPYNKKAINY